MLPIKQRLPPTTTTRVVPAKQIYDENSGVSKLEGAKRVTSTRSTGPLQNITNVPKDQTKKPVLKVMIQDSDLKKKKICENY